MAGVVDHVIELGGRNQLDSTISVVWGIDLKK